MTSSEWQVIILFMKKNFGKIVLVSASIVLLAAGCSRFGFGKKQPDVPQITQYSGKLDKVKQTVDENGQQISGTFTVADGQDALTMLRSFRTIETTSATGTVTSIDGIAPSSKQTWALYINGKPATSSPSDYKVQDNDALEWKLVNK